MKLIKAKLTQVKKSGIFTFMPMENARSYIKGRRNSKGTKTWCQGIKNDVEVEPSKTVYVKSIYELKRNVDVLTIEWIYV